MPAAQKPARDLEPGQPRHLNVEHHQIGRLLGDHLERRGPITGLRDDFDAGNLSEEETEFLPRQPFVVDDDGAKRVGCASLRPESSPARRAPGMTMRAHVPPPGTLSS